MDDPLFPVRSGTRFLDLDGRPPISSNVSKFRRFCFAQRRNLQSKPTMKPPMGNQACSMFSLVYSDPFSSFRFSFRIFFV
jgi:hypothetical protein